MKDLYQKFIIEEDNLIISKVTYHKEIAFNEDDVSGGGMYKYTDDRKGMIFYGESHDFGKALISDIKKSIKNGNVYTNYVCAHSIADKFKFFYEHDDKTIEEL